jgi:hypothetical protein
LEQPLLEHTWELWLTPRGSLGDVVGLLVLAARDVLHSHVKESLLELTHLFKVGDHVGVLRLVSFVGEVDDNLGVALDGDALDAKGDRGPEPSK